MFQEKSIGKLGSNAPSTEPRATNESVLVAFAFTRAVLAIIIIGSVALSGFGTSSSDNILLLITFLCVSALGLVSASRTLICHYRNYSLKVDRPWRLIVLDSALAIGVMAMIDAETSPLAWVALIAPVLETAVLLSMVPAALVWLGLSLAFLALRLSVGVTDDAGMETLTIAIQQVFAVLLVSGPAALLSDSAQQRIDNLSDARRSADQIADRLRRVAQAASDMSQESSIESVLASVSRSAVTIGFDHADVVVRERDGSLTSHSSHSNGSFRLPSLEILTAAANESNLTTITADDDRYGQILHTHELASGHAVTVSSNVGGNGSTAVLRVWSKRRPSTEQELRALGLLAGHAREIHHASTLLAEAKAHTDQLQYQVRHDGLTGLANRAYVLSTLEERIAVGDQIALFFIDLDGFKGINDTFGHRAGDAALLTVAHRLEAIARQGSLVGRMGGDEFIIILPIAAYDTPAGLTEFGLAVVDAVSHPMIVDGHNTQLGASVGLAVHTPGLDADQFISLADGAMYDAKRDSGGLKISATSSQAISNLVGNSS